MKSRDVCLAILENAEIPIGGSEPWSLHVHDDRLWERVLSHQQLGFAEAYIEGWWDCEAVDVMLTRLLESDLKSALKVGPSLALHILKSNLLNHQTTGKSSSNASFHYNLGNDLYQKMLDPEMVYSCGYWNKAKNLEDAQIAKFDLIARKLHLEPGMRVLDIGCGWGGFLRYASQNYGITGVGISPAENQVQIANQRKGSLPLTYLQQDYRDAQGTFERIVSVGMMEHVGPKNFEVFFEKCQSLLESDGAMLHHTISSNLTKHSTDQFFDKYIFPGGVLPSLAQIAGSVENKFIIEDVHNFGPDYDKTLLAWHENINANWKELPEYNEKFRRMWNYYLCSSAAGFRARKIQLLQIVFRTFAASDTFITAR